MPNTNPQRKAVPFLPPKAVLAMRASTPRTPPKGVSPPSQQAVMPPASVLNLLNRKQTAPSVAPATEGTRIEPPSRSTPPPTPVSRSVLPPAGLSSMLEAKRERVTPPSASVSSTTQSADTNDGFDMAFGDNERDEGWDDGWDSGGWDSGDDWNESINDREESYPSLANELDKNDESTVDVKKYASLRGQVVTIQKYGEWGRGKLVPESGGASIQIVGDAIAELQKGDTVVLYGTHKKHHMFGDQFDTVVSMPDASSVPALLRHLIKNYKGIGYKSANDIVDYYKNAGQLDVLRRGLIYEPSSLNFQTITGRKSELIDDEDTKRSRISTLISLQYGTLGIRSDTLNRLAQRVSRFIDSLSPAALARLVADIEEKNKKRGDEKATAGAPPSKAKPTLSPPPLMPSLAPAPALESPASTLTDEQYAGALIAEHEARNFLLPSGVVPSHLPAPQTFGYHDLPPVQDNYDGEVEVEQSPPEEERMDEVYAARLILAYNPYRWIGETEGYTFKTADRIGREEDVLPDDPNRLSALVAFALEAGCQSQGHTYIDTSFLRYAVNEVDSQVDALNAIEEALNRMQIEKEGERYYPKGLLRKEKELSSQIAGRISRPVTPLIGHKISESRLSAALDEAQKAVGKKKGIANFALDETQRKAVMGILTSESSLHVIEGGPGRGKTAIVQVLMETLVLLNKKPETAFCAPVGKAAKVLNSQISDYGVATTIHSLLGAQGAGFNFKANKENPLSVGLTVADEQSMTGLNLGYALFDAIPSQSHTILLGDTNQLLPIDCGNVMKSIVSMDKVDKYMLTETHRNKGKILALVDMVNEGNWPVTKEAIENMESDGDVTLHNGNNALSLMNLESFIDQVAKATMEYGGAEHVGVICPVRRGDTKTAGWNVTYLNEALRERLNPDPDRLKAIIGSRFRLNDRIILTKNMLCSEYLGADMQDAVALALGEEDENDQVRVANGDTGYLSEAIVANVDGARQAIGFVINLDDGRRVLIGHEEREHMGLAYAITVHAAQGSEYKKVFGVVTKGHPSFMHRALLMTMLSRAKDSLEVFGSSAECSRVAGRLPPERNCAIHERAKEIFSIHHQAKDEQGEDEETETETELETELETENGYIDHEPFRPAVGMR